MQTSKPVLCPSCATEFTPDADVCVRCGRELKTLRDANKYQLVCDGEKYDIALRGRTVIAKMELKEAKSTLAIINGTKSSK
jgi:predicted amidophosphoribosyltransferase